MNRELSVCLLLITAVKMVVFPDTLELADSQ